MRIRYTDAAEAVLRREREESEDGFHALRGRVILLSAMPEPDGETKTLVDFGMGVQRFVCATGDWWIVYRVFIEADGEEVLGVSSIWNIHDLLRSLP